MLLGVKDRYMEHESLMEICERFLGKSTEQGVKETGQDGGGGIHHRLLEIRSAAECWGYITI